MSRLAIIPARGGSRRIIEKNIKFFLGKPIIAYAIQNAINSKLFDEVMVFNPDVVLVTSNVVPDFFPGIKVQVFHGFSVGKRSALLKVVGIKTQ